MTDNPPAGWLGHEVATAFGVDPKHGMDADLRADEDARSKRAARRTTPHSEFAKVHTRRAGAPRARYETGVTGLWPCATSRPPCITFFLAFSPGPRLFRPHACRHRCAAGAGLPSARLVDAPRLACQARSIPNVPMTWELVEGRWRLFALASWGGVPSLLSGWALTEMQEQGLVTIVPAPGTWNLDRQHHS